MAEQIKKVLITGATGFTGKFVVQNFLDDPEFDVSLFVRDKEKAGRLGFTEEKARIIEGSFEDTTSFAMACSGQDILINIASLGFDHGESIIKVSEKEGIKKAVFVSTTAIFTKLNPASKQVRIAAEKMIEESALDYVIVRPTMIFGTPDDRNICRLIRFVKKFPVVPIAGPGTYLMQPVFVKDLAEVIYNIVKSGKFTRKAYNVSGEKEYPFNELIDIIARLLRKKIIKLHVPQNLMRFLFGVYESVCSNPRVKVEQLDRLNEDKKFSYEEIKADFGYSPHTLKEVLKAEIDEIYSREL